MSDDELVTFLSGRDAAITCLENLTEEMLDELPELEIISRMGVGLDNVDPALLRARVRARAIRRAANLAAEPWDYTGAVIWGRKSCFF